MQQPWPEFSLFLNQNHTVCPKIETEFLGNLGDSYVFPPKNRWSPKKKVFTEIEADFLAKIGNSNVFSAPKQVISKKKKSSPKFRLHFPPISEIQALFLTESRHELYNFFTTSAPNFLWGGCFQFFTKNRPQKHKNVRFCILHKPMGGARAPRPPWLRYCSQHRHSRNRGVRKFH